MTVLIYDNKFSYYSMMNC